MVQWKKNIIATAKEKKKKKKVHFYLDGSLRVGEKCHECCLLKLFIETGNLRSKNL